MSPHKKILSHSGWIALIFIIGIGASYGLVNGGKIAYGEIYKKTQGFISQLHDRDTPIQPYEENESEIKEIPHVYVDAVSIGFVGDIIPAIDSYPDLLSYVSSYTVRPEIMIGNYEGAAADTAFSKCKVDSKNCFSFNGNDQFLKLLKDASFDVLSVANNHFNDYDELGQIDTVRNVREAGMIPAGMKDEITYVTKNDIKIGIVGFSNYSWTNDLNNLSKVKSLVEEAETEADVVVVVFHGGGEGANYAHTGNGIEWYLGENRGDLRAFAYTAVDSGADIILGSGPHVLRGMEWYQGKLIAYSLGNFAMADAVLTTGILKNSALLNVNLDKYGSMLSGKIDSFEIDIYGIPRPDPNNTAVTFINELSKSDFGDQRVLLNSLGEIQINK